MLYTVFYIDHDISEDFLQEYMVEANDADEAERLFNEFALGSGNERISIYTITDHPEEIYDSHSCSANSDEWGYCSVCGAVVHGSVADYELHGYDPV